MSFISGSATLGRAIGGSLGTIIPGKTGELFKDFDELKKMVLEFNPGKYFLGDLQNHAFSISFDKFKGSINKFIGSIRT